MWHRNTALIFIVMALAQLSGCTGRYKMRLDCIDICKEHGLRYVEVVKGIKSVDQSTGETRTWRSCRCE